MTDKQKRGRPKHWINDLPDHVKKLGTSDQVTEQILKNAKELERLLRVGEPRGVPTRLLVELNDLEDLTSERQKTVLDHYRKIISRIKQGQQKGAENTRGKAHHLEQKICDKNKTLIQRIKPNGYLTVHSVAKRIHDEWAERGVGGIAPSINTLSTYIKQHLQGQAQNSSQGLIDP